MSDHCRRADELGLGGGGLGSATQRRFGESEDRAAVAAGNDGQQAMDRPTIDDGVCEQCDVLLESEGQALTTVNYLA